jgi:hypothetical protein
MRESHVLEMEYIHFLFNEERGNYKGGGGVFSTLGIYSLSYGLWLCVYS